MLTFMSRYTFTEGERGRGTKPMRAKMELCTEEQSRRKQGEGI